MQCLIVHIKPRKRSPEEKQFGRWKVNNETNKHTYKHTFLLYYLSIVSMNRFTRLNRLHYHKYISNTWELFTSQYQGKKYYISLVITDCLKLVYLLVTLLMREWTRNQCTQRLQFMTRNIKWFWCNSQMKSRSRTS